MHIHIYNKQKPVLKDNWKVNQQKEDLSLVCLPLPCPFCLQTNPFNSASTSDGQVWEAQCCVHFSIPAGLLGTLSQCRLGLSTSEESLTSAQGC